MNMKILVAFVMSVLSGVLLMWLTYAILICLGVRRFDLAEGRYIVDSIALIGGIVASFYLLLREAADARVVARRGFLLGAAEWIAGICLMILREIQRESPAEGFAARLTFSTVMAIICLSMAVLTTLKPEKKAN